MISRSGLHGAVDICFQFFGPRWKLPPPLCGRYRALAFGRNGGAQARASYYLIDMLHAFGIFFVEAHLVDNGPKLILLVDAAGI